MKNTGSHHSKSGIFKRENVFAVFVGNWYKGLSLIINDIYDGTFFAKKKKKRERKKLWPKIIFMWKLKW